MSRLARASAWLIFLGAAIVALRLAAVGDLSPPPADSLDALEAWVDDRGAVAAAIALVRLGSELAAWYLLVLSLLHLVGGLVRIRAVHVVADAVATPGVRRLMHAALGVGLAVSATSAGDDPTAAPAAPTMERIPGSRSGTVQDPIDTGTATMRPVDGSGTPGTARMTPLAGAAIAEHAPEVPRPTTWRVQQGDSFWSIAEEILEGAWGRSPSDREIGPFWRALVDANRDRLVTEDPDLVMPGQVFDVPPVPDPG